MKFKLNRGGWPSRPKTIFAPAVMRKAAKVSDKLHAAVMYIHNTVDQSVQTPYGGLYDAVTKQGDWASSEALNILNEAMRQVNQEAQDANNKARELTK